MFLPENFPSSVSRDYVEYQIWDTLQAFCSSISGALAARAMFESIGVGDDEATAYGATLTWLIKDGTGMVGRICFAWQHASFLDSNSKMWRMYADILNDFSFFVDLMTPIMPRNYSIYSMSFAGLLRSIVGVAGGATRSALTQHQAKNNNLADVSAKDSSQETLVNLIALIFNLFLLTYVKDSKYLIWPLFIFFVAAHIFSNFKAVKAIVMNTFNRNRFHIFSQKYLSSNKGQIEGPELVNKLEPVLKTCPRYFTTIKLGCSIKEYTRNDLGTFLNELEDENFSVNFNVKDKRVEILLKENCSDLDLLKSQLQIEIVEFLIQASNCSESMKPLKTAIENNEMNLVNEESSKCVSIMFPKLIEMAVEKGWSLAYTQLSPDVFRYSFSKDKSA